ncbi:MAG: ABC transporter ATP-binding protein [Desulfurococcaceae archaeon]|uniref:ABC transporter ATP-binding protein n=1 Tax=Staphylothermus marinus TaxID=2280 RepID=A0A7C4HEN2_STAMA
MIIFQNVWAGYTDEPVLKGINLVIEPGKVNVLLGPNGSGKTTTMRLILGIIKPIVGDIRVNGIDPSTDPIKVRKMIGYVPEEDLIYYSLRVREYLNFIAKTYGIPSREVDENIERVLNAFLLKEYEREFIGALSHGLKRRVMLAAAFIHDPSILLLDEPFIGIDPRIARALKIVLREKSREGKTILVSTHILEIAEVLADRIILLYQGKVVAEGSVREVVEKAKTSGLEEAFITLTMSREKVVEIVKALMG